MGNEIALWNIEKYKRSIKNHEKYELFSFYGYYQNPKKLL